MKGRITKTGYRRNSPDVGNDFNIIPSNRISMKNGESIINIITANKALT